MEKEIFVHIDLEGFTQLVGKLWTRVRNGKESASFKYSKEWLENKNRFALEPALSLDEAPFQAGAGKSLFGSIGDCAPDRWGRALLLKDERIRAEEEGESARTLFESDYLLNISDFNRVGALRFSLSEPGPFLGQGKSVPPLVKLPNLLSAAQKVDENKETAEELRALLDPGSSLGGARPKASVLDKNGALLIAKFPQKDDRRDMARWEATALELGRKAGLNVSKSRVEKIKGRSVLLVTRFDRVGRKFDKRVPFLSAMSMIGARDNEEHSYLDIVDAIRRHSADPEADMQELWGRVVFSILISNFDDHLRNHAFLGVGGKGWRLSPAYDLNPTPIEEKSRELRTRVTEMDSSARVELALETAEYYALDPRVSKRILKRIAKAVSSWRDVAAKNGITKRSIKEMASAFEHGELEKALS